MKCNRLTEHEVAVLVLNFNRGQGTKPGLESILKLKPGPQALILCDNGSDDDSWSVLDDWCRTASGQAPVPRSAVDCQAWGAQSCLEYEFIEKKMKLVLLRTAQNLGFAGGNNVGLRYLLDQSEVQYIWLLNNDTKVEPDTLKYLIEALQLQPGSGLACSTIRYDHGPGLVQAYGGGRYYPALGSTRLNGHGLRFDPHQAQQQVQQQRDFPLGASMLVSRDFVTQVGLLDEHFFLYFEELDWMLRAKGQFTLAYAPRSIVWHQESASIGAGQQQVNAKSYLGDFHFQRSRLLLSRKHYPQYFPLVVLSLIVTAAKRIWRGQWSRVPMLWQCLREACCVQL